MAKLSAHGAEYGRLHITDDRERNLGPVTRITRDETFLSFRTDGHILSRSVVTFAGADDRDGHRHDYGWKLFRRVPAKAWRRMDAKAKQERMLRAAMAYHTNAEKHGASSVSLTFPV